MTENAAIGIDVGSTTTKAVVVNHRGELVWQKIEPTEPRISEQADRIIKELEDQFGESVPIVATGYGRKLVGGKAKEITEITCHAAGTFREIGHGGTLIDIGGQDSKVISIGDSGEVLDFMMNDKCAAGTGRFLEYAASRLKLSIEEMGEIALTSEKEVDISSTCTVFAESEIVSLIARGVDIPPIVRGLHRALVKRVVAMMRTVGLSPPLMLSGGVAKNPAIKALLEEETGEKVVLPANPQLMGAYGAALLGLKSLQ